jgi:tripartite-type tricarboxylate transporter receptor subunit TctC
VVAVLDRAINELMIETKMHERLAAVGLDPAYLPRDQMDAFVRTELARWAEFIRLAGIEPN